MAFFFSKVDIFSFFSLFTSTNPDKGAFCERCLLNPLQSRN